MVRDIRLLIDIEGCITKGGSRFQSAPIHHIALLSEVLTMLHVRTGIVAGLCSGRQAPYGELMGQALNLMDEKCWSVLENGAILYQHVKGKFIYHPLITPALRHTISKAKSQLWFDIEAIGGELELGKEICMSFNPPSGMRIEKFEEWIISLLRTQGDLEFFTVTRSQSAVDITPKGVSKGSAITYLSEAVIETPLSDIALVGDTKGDHPGLSIVGIPMGPSNAEPATQELILSRGGFIASYPSTLGVIELLGNLTDDAEIHTRIKDILRFYGTGP